MSAINDYLGKIKKDYPNTKEVIEQIEELRDSLHQKAGEYRAQGQSQIEAERTAVASLGDVACLFDELSGNVRTVYINRLNKRFALLLWVIMLGLFFEGSMIATAFNNRIFVPYYESWYTILLFMFAALLGIGIWVAVMSVQCHKSPDQTQELSFPYQKQKKNALIGFVSVSAILFVLNLAIGFFFWSYWLMLGTLIWPLSVIIYQRLLNSGKYDSQQ